MPPSPLQSKACGSSLPSVEYVIDTLRSWSVYLHATSSQTDGCMKPQRHSKKHALGREGTDLDEDLFRGAVAVVQGEGATQEPPEAVCSTIR